MRISKEILLFYLMLGFGSSTSFANSSNPNLSYVKGILTSDLDTAHSTNILYFIEINAWFLPTHVIDSVEISKNGKFFKTLHSNIPLIVKFKNYQKTIFPIVDDTLTIKLTSTGIQLTNNTALYRFIDYYNTKYKHNGGLDKAHRAMLKLDQNDFLIQQREFFNSRNKELDSTCLHLNCPSILIEYLKISMKYEEQFKKLDYLMNHIYYQSNMKESEYLLGDSLFYSNIRPELFSEEHIKNPDFVRFLSFFLDDYYLRAFYLSPDKMKDVSRSSFMFDVVKNKFTGETLDLAESLIIKTLVDNTTTQSDVDRTNHLVEEFKSINTNPVYLDFITKYASENNPFNSVLNFCLTDQLGETLCLKQFRGSNIVLFFTGTWCLPCKQQVPVFEEMISKNQKTDLAFIYVYLEDHDFEKWQSIIQQSHLKGITLFASQGFAAQELSDVNLNSVPRFVLIDKEGKVINANAETPINGLSDQIITSFGY